MKKIWIIGLVVLAIILIVFFAFRFFSNNNQVPLSQYEASRIAIDNTENNENHPQEVKLGSFSTELLSEDKDRLTNSMAMFIILNTASLQIIPTTVIAIRNSLESTDPTKIILPVWISTICAAVAGITASKIFIKLKK